MTMSNLRKYRNNSPQIDRAVYIDSTATIIGDVEIGADSSVWPQSVIRGDVNRIRVGARSNIQDGCIIHVSRPTSSLPDGHPTLIANDVTIGHGAILHGCSIACCVLVGNGAVVMDGVCIESHVIVGANSLVPPGKRSAVATFTSDRHANKHANSPTLKFKAYKHRPITMLH